MIQGSHDVEDQTVMRTLALRQEEAAQCYRRAHAISDLRQVIQHCALALSHWHNRAENNLHDEQPTR